MSDRGVRPSSPFSSFFLFVFLPLFPHPIIVICVSWEEQGHLLFLSIFDEKIKWDSSIYALLIFPTEICGFRLRILIVFLECINFPLIILLETESIPHFD